MNKKLNVKLYTYDKLVQLVNDSDAIYCEVSLFEGHTVKSFLKLDKGAYLESIARLEVARVKFDINPKITPFYKARKTVLNKLIVGD